MKNIMAFVALILILPITGYAGWGSSETPPKDFMSLGIYDKNSCTITEFIEKELGSDAKKSWEKLGDNQWLLKLDNKDKVSGKRTKMNVVFQKEGTHADVARLVVDGDEVNPMNIPSVMLSLMCSSDNAKLYSACPDYSRAAAKKAGRLKSDRAVAGKK